MRASASRPRGLDQDQIRKMLGRLDQKVMDTVFFPNSSTMVEVKMTRLDLQ